MGQRSFSGAVVSARSVGNTTRVLLLTTILVTGCGAPPATVGPSSSGSPPETSPGASGGTVADGVIAASFDDLPFSFTLPTGWTLGTPAQRDTFWQSMSERGAGIAANLAAEANARGAPVAVIAYDGTENDDRNPVLTCSYLSRGSTSPSEAFETGKRQNLEGISASPNLVGAPTTDDIKLPLGDVARIRWREQAAETDISSIGYLFVAGPSIVTCVFRTATAAVAAREAEWEGILRTFESAAHWSVTATLRVGIKPFEIAAGGGSIWVADADSGELSRIEPATNGVTSIDLRTGRSRNLAPWAVAYADSRIWVTTLDFNAQLNAIDGLLLVIDPATGAITDEVRVGAGATGLALGFGSAWVSNTEDRTVLRIDEATLEVTETIKVGASPGTVAVSETGVWVADTDDETVSMIDPATNKVVKTVELGPQLRAMAVGERGVWVSGQDALYLLDAGSGDILERLGLAGIAGLAAGGGKIWATEGLGTRVLEIDEAAAEVVESVTLDTNSWGIAELDGTLWVVQPAAAENKCEERKPGTVTRIDH